MAASSFLLLCSNPIAHLTISLYAIKDFGSTAYFDSWCSLAKASEIPVGTIWPTVFKYFTICTKNHKRDAQTKTTHLHNKDVNLLQPCETIIFHMCLWIFSQAFPEGGAIWGLGYMKRNVWVGKTKSFNFFPFYSLRSMQQSLLYFKEMVKIPWGYRMMLFLNVYTNINIRLK